MMIIKSEFEVNPPRNLSLPEFILQRAGQYGNRTALVDGLTGAAYTYKDLPEIVDNFSASLWRLGLRKGDLVCLITPNCIEFAVVYLGALQLGGIVSSLNPLLSITELEKYISEIEPKFVFTIRELITRIEPHVKRKDVVMIIQLDDRRSENRTEASATVQSLIVAGRCIPRNERERVRINPERDAATICFSSGTTGRPKGCVHTHYNFICNMAQLCYDNHPVSSLRRGEDVTLVIVPLFHAYGQIVCLQSALYMGATVVFLPRFQLNTYLRAVTQYKVNVLMCAPPLVSALVSSGSHSDLQGVRLIVSSAAPLSAQIVQGVRKYLPQVKLIDEYGMTEIMGIYRSLIIDPKSQNGCKPGGRLMPSLQAKIVDLETGQTVGRNKDGEIWIKTRCAVVEYWKNPQATKTYLRSDGWFPTGDVGYFNEEGRIFIVERAKDLIKYNGYQVSPAELESLIAQHPSVLDVAVLGRPDEIRGELPSAFIVKRQGNLHDQITEENISEFVAGKVSPQKKLRGGVYFVDSIPKSPSGKVLRLALRDKLIELGRELNKDSTLVKEIVQSKL